MISSTTMADDFSAVYLLTPIDAENPHPELHQL
jgi:hypothetical protein